MKNREKEKEYCIKFIQKFFTLSSKRKEKIIKKTKKVNVEGSKEFATFLENIKDVYDIDLQNKIIEDLRCSNW